MTTELVIPIRHTVEGYYTLTKRKVATGEIVQEVGPFKNLITDLGLNRIGTASATTYTYIGSGTGAAATTDTQMGTFIAATTTSAGSSSSATGSTPYWIQESQIRRFDPPGSSINVTEVGIGWTSNSVAGLWSRARVVDGVGNPVTITILADEFLDVTYTLRYYPPLTDTAHTVTISGVDYNFVSRSANITSRGLYLPGFMGLGGATLNVYGGPCTLGALTSSITGQTGSAAGFSMAGVTYVNNSLETKVTASGGLSSGNVTGGITGLQLQLNGTVFMNGFVQMTVSPAIPKDNTKSLTLTFAVSWDRY